MIKVNGKEVKFETFPNGETRIVTDNLPDYGWVIQRVSFKYENDSDLIKLMLLKNYMDTYYHGYASKAELVIYYMPYSRMDRSENQSPFTLKYVANFINSLNFGNVVVVEPHSDVTPALLDNVTAKYINFNLIKDVVEDVDFHNDYDYLVFPDAGASKRYSKMNGFKNVLVGHKDRDFETGKIKGLKLIGDESHHAEKAIIVDDLSSYGGTFVHTAKALKKQFGVSEIYLLVAHAENSIFKGELFKHIDKVFTTDSILTQQNDWANKKFEKQLKIYEIEGVLSND